MKALINKNILIIKYDFFLSKVKLVKKNYCSSRGVIFKFNIFVLGIFICLRIFFCRLEKLLNTDIISKLYTITD